MTREELFARDGWRCVYCGAVLPAEALSVDHVHPRVKGGDHSPGNLVTACIACNSRKGGRSLARFLADEPEARAHFEALAVHVWPRHRRALRELIAAELRRGGHV
ncbi:MAG: HNH endonuclease [Gemmatimonadaceae bacterium]|nr:HNH endonuclease [Gemmatimonadaceae bacterium]